MTKNSGMVADYHLAQKRSSQATIAFYVVVSADALSFAFRPKPYGQYEWLIDGFLMALCLSLIITSYDYLRMAQRIEKGWAQAAKLPG